MGRGDKKTRRGKIINRSYGKLRPRKSTAAANTAPAKPASKSGSRSKKESAPEIIAEETAVAVEATSPKVEKTVKATAKKPAAKTPAKKTAEKKAPEKKTAEKKAPEKKTAEKKTAEKKPPAKKAPAKKAATKSAASKATPAKKKDEGSEEVTAG